MTVSVALPSPNRPTTRRPSPRSSYSALANEPSEILRVDGAVATSLKRGVERNAKIDIALASTRSGNCRRRRSHRQRKYRRSRSRPRQPLASIFVSVMSPSLEIWARTRPLRILLTFRFPIRVSISTIDDVRHANGEIHTPDLLALIIADKVDNDRSAQILRDDRRGGCFEDGRDVDLCRFQPSTVTVPVRFISCRRTFWPAG